MNSEHRYFKLLRDRFVIMTAYTLALMLLCTGCPKKNLYPDYPDKHKKNENYFDKYDSFLYMIAYCNFGKHNFNIKNKQQVESFLDGYGNLDSLTVDCSYKEAGALYEGRFDIIRKYNDNRQMFKVKFKGYDINFAIFTFAKNDCKRLKEWFFFDKSGNFINVYQLN